MLADVFGVTLREPNWNAWPHYIAPTVPGQAFFTEYSAKYPAFARTTGQKVAARHGAEVLATTTLPWPAPDPTRFSSIHSNPPWQPTDRPEVVVNRFGKGKAIYCSSPLETIEPLGDAFLSLLRLLAPRYRLESDAPQSVELVLFHQSDKHRYRLTLVNFQKELPNIPVVEIHVRLWLRGDKVRRILQVPDGRVIPHREEEGVVRLQVPRLETLAMFLIEVA